MRLEAASRGRSFGGLTSDLSHQTKTWLLEEPLELLHVLSAKLHSNGLVHLLDSAIDPHTHGQIQLASSGKHFASQLYSHSKI